MTRLLDQIAVVTGAGSGIGKAIATALANEGASVCLVGRTQSKLEETANSISESMSRPVLYPIDLTVDDEMDRLLEDFSRRYTSLDILVLCAGEISHGNVSEAPLDAFDALYRANVRAPYRLIQLLLPLLKAHRGQIVVMNSSVGLRAPANVSQYSATHHAMKAVTDSLRNEVNTDGIRVLSIYPGRTATPRQELIYEKSGQDYKPDLLLQPEDIASVVIHSLTLPWTAEVTDINIRPFLKSY